MGLETCGPECAAATIGVKNSGAKPLETRKGRTVACAVCGKPVWKPDAWLRKVATPEEVASAIVWVASPAAGHTTGELIPVSGGMEGRVIW